MKFELTNQEREYLGLQLVEQHWEKVDLSEYTWVYFDGDTIRKMCRCYQGSYYEDQMDAKTENNRTILLPKTNRGKKQKLTEATLSKKTPMGVYFSYFDGKIRIANYTTQTTFYNSDRDSKNCTSLSELHGWLEKWIKETTEQDRLELEKFKNAKRIHVKWKEGDVFRFRIGRRDYGYGRLLLDMATMRKKKEKFWDILAGQPYDIQIYHIITQNPNIDIKELEKKKTIPSQHIMDNIFYYGECEKVGFIPIREEEDYRIMCGKSKGKLVLQIGKEYKEVPYTSSSPDVSQFEHEGLGFFIDINRKILEQCIKEDSNNPYWNENPYRASEDLRAPQNEEKRKEILKQFR